MHSFTHHKTYCIIVYCIVLHRQINEKCLNLSSSLNKCLIGGKTVSTSRKVCVSLHIWMKVFVFMFVIDAPVCVCARLRTNLGVCSGDVLI